ncbi:MAG: GIY-YIG nuclease family protein [Pseudomonadota bacterium]
MTVGYRDFEFDLPGALLVRLVEVLDGMEAAPLDDEGLSSIPEAQGVYQLFLDGQLTYIGKTDAEAGLAKRLLRHSRKILHRQGLDPRRVTFKAVRIFVFTAIDLETQLIRHYTGKDGTPWNGSGFGANDPGRERDTSKPGSFDSDFPIDIDRPLEIDLVGTATAAEVALRLKAALPYTLRFQSAGKGSRKPHPELAQTVVTMSPAAITARSALMELTRQLPSGWQTTMLSALLIMYKEDRDTYPSAIILARS